jgi:hypothetical protein
VSKDKRKRAVSIRMSGSDVAKVKRLASRLGVRDSDVIRYAVKTMLTKLAPLHDPQVNGRNLLPVFVESGADLFLHFELDANRLEGILNDDAGDEGRVDHDDIQMIAMSGVQQGYGRWRQPKSGPPPTLHLKANAAPAIEPPPASLSRSEPAEATMPSLRDYLYGKYIYRDLNEA